MISKQTVLGILAHVDAGKTTLSEALLYEAGNLRKLGRVDHKDAFLDHDAMERERGITIFSKQAGFSWKGRNYTLLDTPGHVDFGAETERTLQVLDYCILVISGADGVQGHTRTLWKLLKEYRIPVIVFVNKMDQQGTDQQALQEILQEKLDPCCISWDEGILSSEELGMCSEELMEEYLEQGEVTWKSVQKALAERSFFPCFYGSALKLQGVAKFLDGLNLLTQNQSYPDEFGARVYKITRDSAGNRLTHMKITGGMLKAKTVVDNRCDAQAHPDKTSYWQEKVDVVRISSGAGFSMAEAVYAGEICTVSGLTRTFAGEGIGGEITESTPSLIPVLSYRLVLPEGIDPVAAMGKLRQLEEEEPELSVEWKESIKEIHICVMGQVQIEILKGIMKNRFGWEVEFENGHLLYRETISGTAIGIGHYEPLRHYAEVHLLLEPGERGSGLVFESSCSLDELDRNWQRLIMTHLEERSHPGVLTGSPITDMKITLIRGKAHQKHTEGGDFRQATYRAIRQGLMQCENILLEPIYQFLLEIPAENVGRAMSDIQCRNGSFEPPEILSDRCILRGTAPVASMWDYSKEVASYTRGMGVFTCSLKGYEPCHNTEEVLEEMQYDPERDVQNPTSSVFCAHGSGFLVPWNEVASYAHLESALPGQNRAEDYERAGQELDSDGQMHPVRQTTGQNRESQTGSGRNDYITNEEIAAIFKQTYKQDVVQEEAPYRMHLRKMPVASDSVQDTTYVPVKKAETESYFLVDGYNIIFAWEELKELAQVNMDSARDRLIEICCNYQGYQHCTLILVYDAYKVKGNPGSATKMNNIYVVYTKEAETADQYIEKTVHRIRGRNPVTVATSDALEQMIIWGAGAMRLSARGFREEVEKARLSVPKGHLDEKALGTRIQISGGENSGGDTGMKP